MYVAIRNGEYAVLKSFGELEYTPGLPGLDIASLAPGFGCTAVDVTTTAELKAEFTKALSSGSDRSTVIVVTTQPEHASL